MAIPVRCMGSTKIKQKTDYRIVFNSKTELDKVVIQEQASTRKINSELEELCKTKWQDIQLEAKSKGSGVWDSEVYRFEKAELNNNLLHLTVSTIPFSIRLAMNSYTDRVGILGSNYAPFGMFTSCFVRTSDEKLLFIERSGKFFSDRKIAFIGGVLSKTEAILSNRADLFNEVLKELSEEIYVESSLVETIRLTSGYITENFNFCLIFDIRLQETFEEVRDTFKKKMSEGEAANVIGITRDQLREFASTLPTKDAIKFEIMGLLPK